MHGKSLEGSRQHRAARSNLLCGAARREADEAVAGSEVLL